MRETYEIDEISSLLAAWRQGSDTARDAIIAVLHEDLYKIGSLLLKRNGKNISLFTGDLVNEAIVRLLNGNNIAVTDKHHLMALSAKVMRNVLTDNMRANGRFKRRGMKIALTSADEVLPSNAVDLMALEVALRRLHAINPAHAEIVEMRFYGGLTIAEIATLQNVSPSTINRTWAALRLWLRDAINHEIDVK